LTGGGRERDAIKHVLLLTGRPGVGKTTLIRRVAASLAGQHLGGFYTEEIRVAGERRGFRLTTFDGRQGVMASVDLRGRDRVGRYGVAVAVIDELAATALAPGRSVSVYLVDEIGKMECLSRGFVDAMHALLESARTVVATIAQRGSGFIAAVKARDDVEIVEVTRGNRDALVQQVLAWLERRAGLPGPGGGA
jgi:nucleoside-triphosphatase